MGFTAMSYWGLRCAKSGCTCAPPAFPTPRPPPLHADDEKPYMPLLCRGAFCIVRRRLPQRQLAHCRLCEGVPMQACGSLCLFCSRRAAMQRADMGPMSSPSGHMNNRTSSRKLSGLAPSDLRSLSIPLRRRLAKHPAFWKAWGPVGDTWTLHVDC